jgi:hypothetical protein
MMVQMAIISQVHLSKIQLGNSNQIYKRAAEIDSVDGRIAKVTAEKYKAGAASQAEKVAADASYIVSKLRKYQALSQLFAASGKMQATTGMEPHFESLDEISLTEMTAKVKESFVTWNSGILPPIPVDAPVANANSHIPRTKPTPAGPAVNTASSPAAREATAAFNKMLKAWNSPSEAYAVNVFEGKSLGEVNSRVGDSSKPRKPSPSGVIPANSQSHKSRDLSQLQEINLIAKN